MPIFLFYNESASQQGRICILYMLRNFETCKVIYKFPLSMFSMCQYKEGMCVDPLKSSVVADTLLALNSNFA